MFSPLNRFLIDRFGIDGSFLIISAILLNLIACGLVIRPVPIEPAEKAKQKKKEKHVNELSLKAKENQKANELDTQISEENDKVEIKSTQFKSLLNLNANDHNFKKMHNNRLERKFSYSVDHLHKPKYRVKQNIDLDSSLNAMALVLGSQNIHFAVADKTESGHHVEPAKKKSLKETIQSFIDFSLFYDIIFMFFAASNFLTSLGFNAPYIFIVDQAISLGVNEDKADLLLSTIGEVLNELKQKTIFF